MYDMLSSNGFGHGDIQNIQRKEIAQLKSQLVDIGALATEYRSEKNRLEAEVKNYRRREPLVQLLWQEIIQLRTALNNAIAAGFYYDVSDPACRYVPMDQFAGIDYLDVSEYAPDPTKNNNNADAPPPPAEEEEELPPFAPEPIPEFPVTVSVTEEAPVETVDVKIHITAPAAPAAPTVSAIPAAESLVVPGSASARRLTAAQQVAAAQTFLDPFANAPIVIYIHITGVYICVMPFRVF